MADTRDWFPPFMRAPGDAWNGYYAPQQADPNVLTEEDAFRQNYSRDREVLDALNAGWFGPRGGSMAARTAVDYAPSRMASGAERDVSPKSIFQNTTGIFPDWDAAAPKSGLHRMLSNVFGTPTKREQRRARPAQELFTDPRTGERHQTWPEALVRSASTLAGDVMGGEVAGGVGTLGLRREDYADFIPGGGEREGGIPGVRSLFNPALDAQRGNPAEVMMERAQDLAGVLGGGPLTAPRGTASLASGAKRPPIGDTAMPSRRGFLTGFRKPVEVAEPRAPLDIPVEGAVTPNLPAVQDPLARLMSGAEAPKSNLLDQLTMPPAASVPSANALSVITNVPVDRRELLRGAGAVAANASRVGRVAEALMKPAEIVTAAPAALPKFEEIWKRGDRFSERDLNELVESQLEHEFDSFAEEKRRNPTDAEYKKIVKETDAAVRKSPEDFFDEDHWESLEGPRYHDYQLPGGDNYRELLVKHPSNISEQAILEQAKKFADDKVKGGWASLSEVNKKSSLENTKRVMEEQGFQSSSWDEPNVLGHLRMHDRDIPSVGRALHLEELNSEWHQEGKQKGYGTKPDPQKVLAQAKEFAHNMHQKGSSEASWASLSDATKQQYLRYAESNLNRSVPDAPLKDNWPDYLLRRAIKEAVESGHDAVSWTPGEHQLERYGLPTNINKNSPLYPENAARVGGLRDFYDKHLVDRANDIGKQYGAKVEQRGLRAAADKTLSPHDRALARVQEDFEKNWVGKPIKGSGRVPTKWEPGFLESTEGRKLYDKFIKQESSKKSIDSVFESGGGQGVPDSKVPVLRITPQLRKAVKDGSFSLLSDSGKPGAPLAALEKGARPREFWRGSVSGDTRRIKTGNDSWDSNLFVSSDKNSAMSYGKELTKYEAKPEAKIVYEGTKEFQNLARPRKGESLLDFSSRAAEAAKKAGYDAVHFQRQGDVGTAIFNPDKFILRSDSGKPGAPLAALEHAPPFHSAVERALSSAKFDKGSPDQWLGYLRNQPGVRKEELEYLKVDALKGRKSLTRQEMLAHVKDNAPQIKEVWKGGEPEFDPAHAGELAHEIMERDHPNLTPEHSEYFGHFDDAMAQAHEELGFNENGPRHSDANYQLPGGDNYREMLLTMPNKKNPNKALTGDENSEIAYLRRVSDQRTPQQEARMEELMQKARAWNKHEDQAEKSQYRSSHWDEPNVLAHARMNDRVIPDAPEGVSHVSGRPVMTGGPLKSLHLEELQSDWHQTGRKQGYGEPKRPSREETMARLKEYQDYEDGLIRQYGHSWEQHATPAERAEHRRLEGLTTNSTNALHAAMVPDAPFKQTWPDLLLKRLVHEAAAKGYDSVSWTPGAKQAERYDLSAYVDAIKAIDKGDGTYQLVMQGRGGRGTGAENLNQIVSKDKLETTVGKDLAERIIKQNEREKIYSGVDLKVGGEGMRAFYDKMLVDKANALGKKYGAKVEWQDVPMTKQGTDYYLSTVNGRETLLSHSGDRDITNPDTIRAWKKAAKPETLKVPVLRLTPKLREAVLKEGFPLFAGALPFGALDEGVKRK